MRATCLSLVFAVTKGFPNGQFCKRLLLVDTWKHSFAKFPGTPPNDRL